MPIDYSEYPPEWKEISAFIRFKRAQNKCETCGAENGKAHPITGSKVVLTVAHIIADIQDIRYNRHSYDPLDINNNLVAECQRCHLTRDAWLHAHRRKYGQPNKNQFDLFERTKSGHG